MVSPRSDRIVGLIISLGFDPTRVVGLIIGLGSRSHCIVDQTISVRLRFHQSTPVKCH